MENKSESRKCVVNGVRKITEGANKVENKIYNDDVERIVNDPERQEAIAEFHRSRKAKRQRKMLIDALIYLAFALVFSALGIVGWMFNLIAFSVCAACGLYSAFCFGRWIENGKCSGWA